MQHKQQEAAKQPQQEARTTEDFNKNIKDLGLVILIVAVAGWALFKYDSGNQNNNSNNQPIPTIMPEKIIAEKAYTITDQKLAIKPPTDEEVAKYAAEAETKNVVLETTKGKIKLKLNPKDAPFAVASYMKLIDNAFYNGLIFHRVISDFMIQGGDPSGDGTGGPGYRFIDELNPAIPSSDTKQYPKGTVAMARTNAPATNGSQFFIMLADYPLDYKYTVIGKVVFGQDAVDAIGKVATNKNNDKPLKDVKMTKVYLEDVK